ncbi:MAG TPA: AIPR family protein [Thermoanaerobaculia bacterium]|nr:AIPR family protein [Thermoanaerobaculia bacterium]
MSANMLRGEVLSPDPLRFTLPTPEYRSQPIPGLSECKVGDCFVRVVDLPQQLDGFLNVNPRVPNRNKAGVLSGPVIRGIKQTLTEEPENMAIKNQGIYILAESAEFKKLQGGQGQLTIVLSDPERHGIVNGGHTYAAIRDVIENEVAESIEHAYVRLHILQGIEPDKVAEIAEGLNRSKQVDDPSLDNLRKVFQGIRDSMHNKPGEEAIAYHQGDEGEMYITEVLVYLQLFNCERYKDDKHPYSLYRKPKQAEDYFKQELEAEKRGDPAATKLLVPAAPDILALGDRIRQATPIACKRIGFEFGRMKTGSKRTGDKKNRNTPLPFIGSTMQHTVPRGWVMPMLAAFRANVYWDLAKAQFGWLLPLDEVFDGVIDDLVRVCVTEHRDNNMRPEWVGNRESSYRQCYDKILLFLARRGKLPQS